MHIVSVISVASFLALVGAFPSQFLSSLCKASPGTPSWPSTEAWSRLNDTLDGRLLVPAPPGGVCHLGQRNFNEALCDEVGDRGLWLTYEWHTADPVSMQWDNWSNWTCLPRADATCSGDRYPAYVVNATTPEHVVAGVNFARENNIRLNVKSTGHDFLGRSIAPGSLSIWLHHLNALTYHEDAFTLITEDTQGRRHKVIPGDAVTVGGGAQMYDIYRFTNQYGAIIVGGSGKSVGVGGYVTGGGHGLLGPTYGLAADNVLQMEVVTPDGVLLTVNEKQHSDIFWALRGGGGSTFGVITSVTFKAHPTPKVQYTNVIIGMPRNATQIRSFLTWILAHIPAMADAGLVGYDYFSAISAVPIPDLGLHGDLAGLSGSLGLIGREPEALQAELDRIEADLVEEFGTVAIMLSEPVKEYDNFLNWLEVHYDKGHGGQTALLKSRLTGEEALKGDPDAILDAIMSATSEPVSGMHLFLLGGKGVMEAEPRGGSNAINPGWRKALVHSLAVVPIPQFNRTAEAEGVAKLDADWEALRKLTPDLGAYLNEASAFEKDAPRTFWGDNYERLLSIKRAVDPNDVFWCSPCVGNERWTQTLDGQLCRVESVGENV